MKSKHFLLYLLITITIVICSCHKADNKQPEKQNNNKIKQLASNNLKKVNAKSKKTIITKNTPTKDLDLTSYPEIKEMLKGAQKLYFNDYYYDSNNKYVRVVKTWVSKEMEEEVFKCIEKKNLLLILVDLNNDGEKDIITIPCSAFCSGGPHGCSTPIFLSPDYKAPYRIGLNVFQWEPIYILNSTTNNLKDLILNDKFFCKYKKHSSNYKQANYKNDYYYVCDKLEDLKNE